MRYIVKKAIKYSENHVHVYRFDRNENAWMFCECRVTSDTERCLWIRERLPRGTRFDMIISEAYETQAHDHHSDGDRL